MTELAAPPIAFDRQRAHDWLQRVHQDTPGLLSVVHQTAHGKFVGTGGTVANHAAALDRIEALDKAGARGIYLRTTTLTRRPATSERGSTADAHALPGLWADVDFGTIGHKPGRGLPLPPTAEEAWRIIDTSGLPAPTLWVHSGGGLYPWWLLDEPLILDDTTRDPAEELSTGWQQAIARKSEAKRS